MSRNARRLVTALLLGVVLYGVAIGVTGFRDLRESLATFRWSAFGAAAGLATGNYLLRFLRWEFYLSRLSIRGISRVDSLLVFLSGFVLTITPGKVGEVFKSAVLAETHGVPIERTAPIVIAERLSDVIGVVALILCGSVGFPSGLPWALAGVAAIVAGVTLIVWERPSRALVSWLDASPRLSALAPKVGEAIASLRILSTPSAILLPIALSVVAWGLEGLALWVVLQGFAVRTSVPLAVFFYETASLAGALIPVPGGLGVVEALLREQLVHLGGVPATVATASMILIRFATLWWAVVVGFMALAVLRARYPRLRGSPA